MILIFQDKLSKCLAFVELSCNFIFFLFFVPLTEQWKPINPEEKKRYDREFLLGFQFISASMHKPEGLPHISDVVLDKVKVLSEPNRFNLNCLLTKIIITLLLFAVSTTGK